MGDRETSMVPFSTASWLGLHPTPSLWVIPELETVALPRRQDGMGRADSRGSASQISTSSCWVESCRAHRCSPGTGMGGREVGEPVLGQRDLKVGWGGVAGAPEIWRSSMCGVEEEGCGNEGHCSWLLLGLKNRQLCFMSWIPDVCSK